MGGAGRSVTKRVFHALPRRGSETVHRLRQAPAVQVSNALAHTATSVYTEVGAMAAAQYPAGSNTNPDADGNCHANGDPNTDIYA